MIKTTSWTIYFSYVCPNKDEEVCGASVNKISGDKLIVEKCVLCNQTHEVSKS